MSRRQAVVAGVGAVIVALSLGYIVGRARAAGIPTVAPVMTYTGTLTDASGTPLTGSKNLQVQLWDVATGGTTPACMTTSSAQTLSAGGNFQVPLPDTCVAAVRAKSDLWAEVLVDGGSLGRTKIGAVPYAVEGAHATAADSATTAATANAAGGALKTALDALQLHDLYAFKKGGNNGTANCDLYCTGDAWADRGPNGNGRGTCVGSYRPDVAKYTSCTDPAPGMITGGLECWCSQPPP